MMEKRIDLHIHTSCSDGKFTPQEIIDKASLNGVSAISITDHDTVEAYTQELFDYAREKNIKLIPGVEISTKIKKAKIHVLGYNIDLSDKDLLEKLTLLRNVGHEYLKKVAEKLFMLGYFVNVSELDKIDAITKAHISLDIISNAKNREKLLEDFGHIPTKGEFIETIMNEGCPAYVLKNTISPKDAAELIRKAKGKVVLAHPVAYKYEDGLTLEETLDIINDMKADGIEANYIYIDRSGNKINNIKMWRGVATDNHLKTTIGSDFHVEDKIHPVIGLVNEDIHLTLEEAKEIVAWLVED